MRVFISSIVLDLQKLVLAGKKITKDKRLKRPFSFDSAFFNLELQAKFHIIPQEISLISNR